MPRKSKVLYFIISLFFFIAADMYFSNQILRHLYKLPENPLLDLIFIRNDGAAFNILQNSRIFLIAFSIIALIAILFYIFKNISKFTTFALMCTAVMCAGIFCNLYERIIFGYVRDFFKLNFIDFPVFNISDIFINVSVFAIVIIIIKSNYFRKS